MIMQHGWEYNTEVLTQSVLAGAGLAVRLRSSVHHAGLLVVAAASGASAAVSAHAFTEVCVSQLSLTLQQGVWVTVWVPQHWTCHRKLVSQLHLIIIFFFFCSSFNADWLIKNPYCGYPSIVDFNCKDISTVWCWLIQACYSVHFYISPHLQLISLRLSSELSLLHHVRGTRLKYKKHLQAAVKQGHLKSHEICFLIGLQVEIQLLPVCFEKLDQRGPNFSNFHITVLLQLLYLKQNILYY